MSTSPRPLPTIPKAPGRRSGGAAGDGVGGDPLRAGDDDMAVGRGPFAVSVTVLVDVEARARLPVLLPERDGPAVHRQPEKRGPAVRLYRQALASVAAGRDR